MKYDNLNTFTYHLAAQPKNHSADKSPWLIGALLILGLILLTGLTSRVAYAGGVSGSAIISSLTGATKVKVNGQGYAINVPIMFALNSANQLTSQASLDKIGKALVSESMARATAVIQFPTELAGEKGGEKLTAQRADFVKSYLVKKYGIERSRLKIQGHQQSKANQVNIVLMGLKN
jgi:hypothetical protein